MDAKVAKYCIVQFSIRKSCMAIKNVPLRSLTPTFMDKDSLLCITLTPFQETFNVCQEPDNLLEPGKICMAVIICFFYLVALISTLSSYYTISKELNIIKPKTTIL
jgi:hypothetical protein